MQFTNIIANLVAPHEEALGRPLKLVIHAGTPKTGTTSLQTYLEKKQSKLRRMGVLYPHNLEKITNPDAPKHHWFDKNMTSAHSEHFTENIKNVVAQIDESTHTIILSSEGIYNYWWDFPDESKLILKALGSLFETQIWVWFREPLAFMESYYKQCIRNPQVESNPCYGKNLSFAEMLEIEWFYRHLNYRGFVSDCRALFGENSVEMFNYKEDVVSVLIDKLGMSTPHDNPTRRQNNSLHSASVELLRTVNQFDLKPKDKEQLIPHLRQMDTVFRKYDNNSLIDEASRQRVFELSKEYNAEFSW